MLKMQGRAHLRRTWNTLIWYELNERPNNHEAIPLEFAKPQQEVTSAPIDE
jgi:hypothetical protein